MNYRQIEFQRFEKVYAGTKSIVDTPQLRPHSKVTLRDVQKTFKTELPPKTASSIVRSHKNYALNAQTFFERVSQETAAWNQRASNLEQQTARREEQLSRDENRIVWDQVEYASRQNAGQDLGERQRALLQVSKLLSQLNEKIALIQQYVATKTRSLSTHAASKSILEENNIIPVAASQQAACLIGLTGPWYLNPAVFSILAKLQAANGGYSQYFGYTNTMPPVDYDPFADEFVLQSGELEGLRKRYEAMRSTHIASCRGAMASRAVCAQRFEELVCREGESKVIKDAIQTLQRTAAVPDKQFGEMKYIESLYETEQKLFNVQDNCRLMVEMRAPYQNKASQLDGRVCALQTETERYASVIERLQPCTEIQEQYNKERYQFDLMIIQQEVLLNAMVRAVNVFNLTVGKKPTRLQTVSGAAQSLTFSIDGLQDKMGAVTRLVFNKARNSQVYNKYIDENYKKINLQRTSRAQKKNTQDIARLPISPGSPGLRFKPQFADKTKTIKTLQEEASKRMGQQQEVREFFME